MNILVLTARFGMGHVSAADAVKEEMEDTYNDSNITVIDLIDYLFPLFSDKIYGVFGWMAGGHHDLYNTLGKMAELSDGVPMKQWFIHRFQRLMDRYDPDLIISTWPVGSKYLGTYKKKTKCSIPSITCITDISVHSEWISPATSAYVVGDDIIKEGLTARGIEPQKIFVGGIPVRREFKSEVNIGTAVKREVLIMGGGLGLIPDADKMLAELSEMDGVHVTVVTGKNKTMFSDLNGKYKNTDVAGFTEHVDEYMKKSDMIITKAGGITLFEAIHTETPMLVIDPFLEQEKSNAAYIEKKGIGRVMRYSGADYSTILREMLDDDNTLSEMKSRMHCIKMKIKGHGLEEAVEEIRKRA